MVAQIDLSAFQYILPLLSFLVVFIICLVLIKKVKFIDNLFLELFISFAIAIIFVSAVGPRDYILEIIPWFAVAIIGLFLIMSLSGFLGPKEFPSKTIGIVFIVILGIIFLGSAFFVFSSYIMPYLPGYTGLVGNPGNPALVSFFNWVYAPRVAGALLLLGVGVVVSWVLIKAK